MPVAKPKAVVPSGGRPPQTGANSASSAQLNALKQQMMKDAETLLIEKLPERITHLNGLLKSADFNLCPDAYLTEINVPRTAVSTATAGAAMGPAGEAREGSADAEAGGGQSPAAKRKRVSSGDDSSSSSSGGLRSDGQTTANVDGTKVMLLPCGSVDVNQTIARLFDVVKPLILQQVNDCNLLKMWIELLIPKVEDGNNFGVDIQEECLKEVSSVESEAAIYLDHASRYFLARAKLIAKVAKYPHVEDFRKTVSEIDEKQYLNLRLVVQELRNNYAGVHDMLTKNLEKIKRPRTSNATDSLY